MTSPTAAVLGELGLPAPIRELSSRTWDVIIAGAGHNGLACAAYLARAGKRVLILEARSRVGGACTIEQPFPETFPSVHMSPCAYLAGLLHPLILSELNLPARGFKWTPAVNGLFVPFLDGSSIQLWDDDETCEAASRRGELPDHLWCEIYFQSVHDPTVAPFGLHTMSVFAQYVPYTFAHGTWNTRRDEVQRLALKSLARFCSNIDTAVLDVQVLGPPDIEQKVGLTGGHIFQCDCLPAHMFANRLTTRTPMPGVYLCGAATHPGGSVIGINGRNAAMAVLNDLNKLLMN